MRTSYAGSAGTSYISLPWGDGYTATVNASGSDQDNEHYAGLERDAESGTEHAQFRNYASAQGRWLSPDPYIGSYDLTNPQSMNRYAYALNNPTSIGGLFWIGRDTGDESTDYTQRNTNRGVSTGTRDRGALGAIEKVATPAMAVATAADIMAHGTCAMMADPAAANAASQSVP
jgi:RHS repeat-associated protein